MAAIHSRVRPLHGLSCFCSAIGMVQPGIIALCVEVFVIRTLEANAIS